MAAEVSGQHCGHYIISARDLEPIEDALCLSTDCEASHEMAHEAIERTRRTAPQAPAAPLNRFYDELRAAKDPVFDGVPWDDVDEIYCRLKAQQAPAYLNTRVIPCPVCGEPTFWNITDGSITLFCMSDACKWKQPLQPQQQPPADALAGDFKYEVIGVLAMARVFSPSNVAAEIDRVLAQLRQREQREARGRGE